MGNLDKRIEALERLYRASPGYVPEGLTEEERSELAALLARAKEQAEREEEAGDPRRRMALEELEEFMMRRAENNEP